MFAGFTARMAESDFSGSCIIGYGSSPSRCGPAQYRGRSTQRSPGSRARSVRTCQVLRPRRVRQALALTHPSVLPSTARQCRHPGQIFCRGSIAGLCVPLSTLRRRLADAPRMTRGQHGFAISLLQGLAPFTPCRSPGALSHVTARRIAQPPTATFVTRLRPFRLPGRAARQLPDQSTILRVASSSTGHSRLRGALPLVDIVISLFLQMPT